MQTLFWDARVRTLAVLVPAMGVMIWIASSLASQDFLVPGLVLAVFVVLVIFTTFVKTVRFEAIMLCALISGYLVGNRGFADLSVAKPLYPGELVLALTFVCILVRFALTRELPDFSGWIGRTIILFLLLGAIRLWLDYKSYRMDAIRDSAMVYYALFFFFGRQLVTREPSSALLEKCLARAFLALVPIAILSRVAPDVLMGGGRMTLFFQKDDLLTTFAAVAVFTIYTRPGIYRWNWLRVTLILFYLVFVVCGFTRASLGGLIIGSILLGVAGQKKFFLYPVVAFVLGVTVLAGFAVSFGKSQTTDPAVFVEKMASMVDVTGQNRYDSDYGELKAGNNMWRRKLWQSFIDDTSVSPMFGRGFGFDFLANFEDNSGAENGLRSAHNFYVTFYGRMGVIGIVVFLIITGQIIVGGIRAALQVRAGTLPLEHLSYWCAIWAILVSSSVGVVLEGPVGAVVFWTFFGVAVQHSKTAARASREIARSKYLSSLPPIPLPKPRRRAELHGQVSNPA